MDYKCVFAAIVKQLSSAFNNWGATTLSPTATLNRATCKLKLSGTDRIVTNHGSTKS